MLRWRGCRDNLDNSFLEAFTRMKELAGDKAGNMDFIRVSAEVSTVMPGQATQGSQ